MSTGFVEKVDIDISAGSDESKSTAANDVNTPNSSYIYMSRYWQLIDIVADGFESVRNQIGNVILPIFGEGKDPYQARLKHLDFLPLFNRLVGLSASMICRKSVTITGRGDGNDVAAEEFRVQLENIDSMGNSIDVVLENFLNVQIRYSIAGIMVDAPALPPEGLSLAQEKQFDMRPYWVIITPKDVIDWRTIRIGCKLVLTHLRIRSTTDIQINEFKSKTVPIIKVYDLEGDRVLVRTFIQTKADGQNTKWGEDSSLRSYIGLPYIPYFSMSTNTMSPNCARPTLYELAVVNVNHTRVASDLMFALNLAAHPKLKRTRSVDFVPDFDEKTPVADMAPDKVLTPAIGENYDWLSAPDTAFSALERRVEKFEKDAEKLWTMAVMPHKSVAESAESKKMSSNQSSSILLKTVIALDSLLAQCVQAHYDLMDKTTIGATPPVSLNANRDLDTNAMAFNLLSALGLLVQNRQLTVKTLLELLVRGQILPEDFDIEQEVADIDALPPLEAITGGNNVRGNPGSPTSKPFARSQDPTDPNYSQDT